MSAPLRSQRQPFHSLCLRHGLRPGLCSSVPTSVRVNFVPTWNLMPATHFHFKKSPSSRSASFLKPASLPTFVEMPSFFKGSHARAPLVLGASPHISAVPRACSFPFRTSPGSILLCSCSPGSCLKCCWAATVSQWASQSAASCSWSSVGVAFCSRTCSDSFPNLRLSGLTPTCTTSNLPVSETRSLL